MCSVDVYENLNPICSYSVSSGCVRPFPGGSTSDALKYLCNNLNLIDIWLQKIDKNYI